MAAGVKVSEDRLAEAQRIGENAGTPAILEWMRIEGMAGSERDARGYARQYGLWILSGRPEQPLTLTEFKQRAAAAGVEQVRFDSPQLALFWKAVIDTVLHGKLASSYNRAQLEKDMGRVFEQNFGLTYEKIHELAQLDPFTNIQITGDDLRMADVWTAVLGAAANHGWCENFDNLAAQVGGPRRDRYRVTVEHRREMEPA